MSARVDQRQLARDQRRHLKRVGFDEHDIQVFAQIFTTPDDRDDPRFGCAADTSEEDR